MTKLIPLTQGKFALVDDEDYDFLMQWKWRHQGKDYAARTENLGIIDGKYRYKNIRMHRVVNNTPDGYQTDHIDGNRLNNTRANLRSVTNSQNSMNRKKSKNASSKYKGVSWCKEDLKWVAAIHVKKKRIYLGHFSSEDDAGLAYNSAAIKFHGEFAAINNIPLEEWERVKK